jgi:hypothetical protein
MDRTDGTAADSLNGEGHDKKHGQWKAQFHTPKLEGNEPTALKISSEQ